MEEDMNAQAQLCYVKLPFVWFTTNFDQQRGDDWNDVPYECNAGQPYQPDPARGQDWELFRVAVFANPYKHQLLLPEDGYFNSPWSVEDINKGWMPWLRLTNLDSDSLAIAIVFAGMTYADFKDFAYRRGLLLWTPGSILLPKIARKENKMLVKITVEVWTPGREEITTVLLLDGENIQSVRLNQWIEQTISRLCKKVAQQKKECCAS